MGSEVPAPVVDQAEAMLEATEKRMCPGKTKGKVPKRIHKAEREKMKREQLNELFDELASAIDISQLNSGKASVLCEATRLLKDLVGQIDSLKKENVSLSSECRYITVEKNELKEENSVIESEIGKLQSELESRVAQSNPNPSELPPECHQPKLTPSFPRDSLGLSTGDATLQQPSPAIFVAPFHPDQPRYPMATSHVSKPQARYPTSADLWPSQLLGQQISATNGVQLSGGK